MPRTQPRGWPRPAPPWPGLIGPAALALSIMAIIYSPAAAIAADTLTLEEAVARALEHNPRLEAQDSDVDAAKAMKMRAQSGLYPQVSVTETWSRTDSPMWAFATKLNQGEIGQTDFIPDKLNDPADIENWNTALSVVLPVFDSGRTWVGVDQAGLNVEAARLGRERARQEVINDTVTAYAMVLYARDSLEVVDKALDTARAHRKMIDDFYETGLVVKSDQLRAGVRVAELEQTRLTVAGNLEVARAALNATMGVDISEDREPAESAEKLGPIEGDLESWTRTALQNRPDLRQAKLMVRMSDKEVDKAKASYLPSLYLQGKWEMNSEDFDDQEHAYMLGAMAKMDLFTGFNKYSGVKEAEANSSKARSMTRMLELGVEVQVKQAYMNARSSYDRIGVAERSVAQAEEGLRIVKDRYQAGLYTIVNLLDAETALQQARTNRLTSIRDYRVARSQLALAAGVLDKDFK